MSPSGVRKAVVLLVASATLIACGSDATDDSSPRSSEAGACPTSPISVVVTVDQWGDIVERLAGECGDVTTIIEGSSGDPHDFEPTPSDNAAFTDAQLVVMNGLGYDQWADDALQTLPSEPRVVDAGDVVGLVEGDNPHLWYDPEHVRQVAAAVTDELRAIEPEAAPYLDEQAARWRLDLQPYADRVEAMRAAHAGTPYGATESVFDPMADALGLVDETPAGYRNAAANESEPSPGDILAFEDALTSGAMHVLVFNPQTEGAVPDQLRDVAEGAGVPVVEVTETLPAGRSFVDWQIGQLDALAEALG